MLGAFGEQKQEDTMFSGHAFQDVAEKRPSSEKQGFDLVGCLAPLLDAMMVNHRLESDLHLQRMTELRKAGAESGS